MRLSRLFAASGTGLLLLGSATPPAPLPAAEAVAAPSPAAMKAFADSANATRRFAADVQAAAVAAAPPEPPTPQEALADGVLIVVSLPSQRLFVFRDGESWASSRISTGRRGHETPTGTFPILQKKVHHRSTLYDGAPMPYMQRLTWDGIALHAGNVPGYPASHGCIRLPRSFAQDLYRITGFSSTLVIVTDEQVTSAEEARTLA